MSSSSSSPVLSALCVSLVRKYSCVVGSVIQKPLFNTINQSNDATSANVEPGILFPSVDLTIRLSYQTHRFITFFKGENRSTWRLELQTIEVLKSTTPPWIRRRRRPHLCSDFKMWKRYEILDLNFGSKK